MGLYTRMKNKTEPTIMGYVAFRCWGLGFGVDMVYRV